MWGIKSVLGPRTSTHFPTSPPFPSPHAYTLPHSPHTLSHTLPTHLSLPPPTSQHISLHLPPHPPIFFPQLPWPPPTPQHTSLFTPCTLPTSYPTFQLCGKATKKPDKNFYGPIKFFTKIYNSKSSIKFFTATGNLQSCFGVGNVNFRCMKVWQSYSYIQKVKSPIIVYNFILMILH